MDIDRTKVCPFLLRCFWNQNNHYEENDYKDSMNDEFPPNEVQAYTWPDASFREIVGLLQDVVPETRDQDAVLEFSFVYPNPRGGGFIFRKVATVSVSDPGSDDDLTLKKARFHIGDYIDISIILPS